MAARTVDVVIPTRDTRDMTIRCLRALQHESSTEIAVRCIVVDNGSRDGTAEAVAERMPDIVVIRNARNAGYGEAVNQGARRGAGEHVLILNSDAVARSGAVAKLARFLDEHPDCVVASGQLVHLGTDLPQVGFAIRAFPTPGRPAGPDDGTRAPLAPQSRLTPAVLA